jgi:hypothetical protein
LLKALAAAHAAERQFDEAVACAWEALELLPADTPHQELRSDIETGLRLYEAHRAGILPGNADDRSSTPGNPRE